MADIKNLLSALNEEQIKPVLDTEGAVLVIAGAGSGKTRVLTTRIAYLIMEKGVSPDSILAITFTNKAAGEMKERLTKAVGGIGEMWVCTIHSMCVRILRSYIDKIGFDRNFTIYDETDKEKTLKRVFEDLGYDADKLMKSAKNYISIAKNACLTPDDFEREFATLTFCQEITNVYRLYEAYLNRSNALDFDDLLFRTYQLFLAHPEVASYYSDKFKYVHIDEFQDTNKVQFIIAERLALTHGNLFVVGDDDQSIYGWRGAEIDNILSFDKTHRGAKVYKLERNYRSTKKILQLANGIIKGNRFRREKELWTENGDGARVEVFVGNDENNEATFTAIQIKNLMDRNSELSYKDFAVFMRLNALSRAYEQEFIKYGIAYKVYGGFRFFERKEIKDVLSYLKIINNPFDDESFLRSVGCPKRGIGEKSLRDLREYCVSKNLCLYDGVCLLEDSGFSNTLKTKFYNFKKLIDEFREFSRNNSVPELIKHILDTTSFLEQFAEKNEENTSKLYNISELKNSAEEFVKDNKGATLNDYLSSITLSSDTDDIKSDDAVSIATIHASKGLEFKCVFVAGLDEGVIPAPRSVGNEDELEEERRLMYVAVTRAKERLYLTRATSRYMYGRREFMAPSRFLKDAQKIISPEKYVERAPAPSYDRKNGYDDDTFEPRSFSSGYSSSYAKTFLKDNKPTQNQNINYASYKAGVKVKHAKFGLGTVIVVKGTGENVIVDVAFKGIGIKSLSVKYAPMEIING